MARSVRALMTDRVVTVRPENPVSLAVDLMRRYGFSALPVVDPLYRLVGMVSLLDVIQLRESERSPEDAVVGEIMNSDPLSMPPTAKPSIVAHRLRTYGELRVMPIVKRGVLVGVVTRGDLLRPPKKAGLLDRLTGRRDDRDEVLALLARPGRGGPPAADDDPITRVMTADVVTVRSRDPISVAVGLLLRHRFSGLPVVEADGRLVGIISEADMLGDPLYRQAARGTVGGVMTSPALAIPTTATVGEARKIVADCGLRVLLVEDGGKLAGIVARVDLV